MKKFGYVPALDGVRALAVISVIGFHAVKLPFGGDLGVDVFFVLSGFLITTLLLAEHGRTGTISLRAFRAPGDSGFVHAQHCFGMALPIEPLHVAKTGGAQPVAVAGICRHAPQGGREGGDVERIDDVRRIRDDLGERPALGTDDRTAARHRFQRGKPESLEQRRVHHRIRGTVQCRNSGIINKSQEADVAGER